ncbi:MAG: DUF7344 domain-containing protein [Haloferacaceae archaeon]
MTRNGNDTDTESPAKATSTAEPAPSESTTRSAAAEDDERVSATDADTREIRADRNGSAATAEAREGESTSDSEARDRPATDSEPEESTTEDDEDAESLSLDHVFGILKNRRRRRVLRFLKETEGTVSLSETAEQIAATENDKDVSQITSAERKRVYVGLYQCHLPKMDSMDIVSFNKPRGTIDLGEHADEVFEYLETDDEEPDRSWHAYSASLSVLGLCVLVGAMAVRPMTGLPVVEGAVALILLSFLTYALVGMYSTQAVDDDA